MGRLDHLRSELKTLVKRATSRHATDEQRREAVHAALDILETMAADLCDPLSASCTCGWEGIAASPDWPRCPDCKRLVHVLSNDCWCDPEVIEEEGVDVIVVHRRRQ